MAQRQMPLMGEARQPAIVQPSVIARLPNAHQALLLQINLSGYEDRDLCELLQIDPGHFSRCRSQTAHFPTAKLGPLQGLCGNLAMAQYLLHLGGQTLGQATHPLLLASA